MTTETLKQVLMRRDEMTSEEADIAIGEGHLMVLEGADPEYVLYTLFGLEPDYVFDLIGDPCSDLSS